MKCTVCRGHGKKRGDDLKVVICNNCKGTGEVEDGRYKWPALYKKRRNKRVYQYKRDAQPMEGDEL